MIQISQLESLRSTESTPGDGLHPLKRISEAASSELIPAEQWSVYERVLKLACERSLKFALGGGLVFSHYANRWRNTKDLDLYIRPQHKDAMIAVLHEAGLKDYFD